MLDVAKVSIENPIKVTSFANLVLVWNPGISFGMFSNAENTPIIFSAVSMIIVLVLLIWLFKKPAGIISLSIGFIIGGAIGNVIDRLKYGAVVDFLDVHYAGYHWPAFNVADAAVFVGAVTITVYSLFFEKTNQSSS